MRLKVFDANVLIGEAAVLALDPPMGVVMARFSPTDAYEICRHASVIDGELAGDRSDILRVETENGVTIKSAGISILDFTTLNERELHVLGIREPLISESFEDHPDT